MPADIPPPASPGARERVLVVENARTSGPGRLASLLGPRMHLVRPWRGDDIPEVEAFDAMVLLGGGFLPDDDDRAPWLPWERHLARRCVDEGIPVLGICLGAQLLAAASGGVVQGPYGEPERGETVLDRLPSADGDPLLGPLPERFTAREHHVDQITALPAGAVLLASSPACRVQAFRLGDLAWGVQFHPEVEADATGVVEAFLALVAHRAGRRGPLGELQEPVLALRQVGFVRNGRDLLSAVDWSVHGGERWALLGANGAGKSTLLSLCGAVNHPSAGTVHVLGKRMGRVEIRQLRESIGHVNPRHPLRSPLTVEQVVLTAATGTIDLMPRWEPTPGERARARELVELLGIAEIHDRPWPVLSQGERGRALIARALFAQPRLLLLDEPTTGLDVAAREQLLETIEHVHATHPQLASILVTHHLEELPPGTTHALLIRDGRITRSGKADGVLTTEAVTDAFGHPIAVERRDGRWSARAGR